MRLELAGEDQKEEGEEGEKEKEKEQATLIKSRGRHLAGGEI